MRRACVLGVLVMVGAAVVAAGPGGQQEPRIAAIQSMGVADNLYVISGGGGHTAMLVTSEHGVVLVDTKNPGWGPAILEVVSAVTDQPVTTIINTHAHGDHVGSNADFPAVVRIVAHDNARKRMGEADAAGSPGDTFQDRFTLFEGRDRIELYHLGAGHTDGDTIVVFPELETAHMGDLFAGKTPPFIDRSRGGSGVAYPETLAKVVAQIPGVSRVIPGHAPPPPGSPIFEWMTWEDVETHAAFVQDLLDASRAALQAGQSPEEAVAGFDLPQKYPDYDLSRVARTVEAIYDELRP